MTPPVTPTSTGPGGRHARLGRPELAPLWDELFRRFSEGGPPTTVTLRDLTLAQRRALADLLGDDRLPGPTTRLRVARLATALGLERPDQLRALVEAQRGPVADRRAARLAARQARDELWSWLRDEAGRVPLATEPIVLTAWVEGVRGAGVPRDDVVGHRRRLAGVLRVLRSLPCDGVSLAGLANDALGDPHALDAGRRAARLTLDAIADMVGRPRPADAEASRLLWEEVGVVPDPLSSTVLSLGVRPAGDDPLAVWLRAAAGRREPVVMTLSQLRRWPVRPLPAGAVAYTVENPSLVAEAAKGDWAGPPIVCSSGRPTVAVVTLLRQLGAAGAELRQHADFDPAGLGITAWLADRAGTLPWRMGSQDYLTAADANRSPSPLQGRVPATPWDPALQQALESRAVVVPEEAVRGRLLAAMADTRTL